MQKKYWIVMVFLCLAMVGSALFTANTQQALAGAPTTITLDGAFTDWDGDELVVDDPTNDSIWGSSNELDNLYVTWDANNLYVGVEYTISSNAMIVYIDTGVTGGETDFSNGGGYSGAYPRSFLIGGGRDVDLMLARWDQNTPQVYRITDGTSTEIMEAGKAGSAAGAEFSIPWNSVPGIGKLQELCFVTVIAGGDNYDGPDAMPDNPVNGDGAADTLSNFYCVNFGTVIINEMDADQTGTDTAEFVELFDGGVGSTPLSGMTLVFFNGSNDLSYRAYDLDGYLTDEDGYFILCGNAANTPNCDLDVSPDTDLIQNGQDAIALYAGDATTFPTNSPVTVNNLLDALVYDTDDSDDPGLLVLLNEGQPQINENANTRGITESNQRCSNGSGGARNTDTYRQFLPTPGTENFCGRDAVIINEVDADTPSTDVAEFLELYDGGVGNVSLDGLALVFFNGSSDLSYGAYDLDGYSTDAEGYFVICVNAANVANCDWDVTLNQDMIQNGQDAVALYVADASAFPTNSAVSLVNLQDALVYDTSDPDDAGLLVLLNASQPQVDENANGQGANESNQRCPNGSGGARNTDTYDQYPPTPGAENTCGSGGPALGACYEPATKIHLIQGAGTSSPETGNIHIIEGVVVGDFQSTTTQLGGFFLQEEDADVDTDPLTSEGIFVFDNGAQDVAAGDVVRVIGTVAESFGQTQLGSVTALAVCASGASVTAAQITLPQASTTALEPFEGMLVQVDQMLYVTENYTLGRYGEVDLSVDGPLMNPTNVITPGLDAVAMQAANDLKKILIDDGSNLQNPVPLPPYFMADKTLRRGDTTPGLEGVLAYGFSRYRIHPTVPVEFTRQNERTTVPTVHEGLYKIVSFNVLNYFTTIDTGADICGPSGDMECRGADSELEFTRQRAKIINAMVAIDADVYGLIEIENNPITATQDLVNGLNDIFGAGTYDLIDTGYIGTDAIKLAIIYKTATATPVGDFAILDSTVDPDFIDTKNRPTLAQTFEIDGVVLTVVVNHLKSKGSSCSDVGDPLVNDGQGECNLTRTKAAEAIAEWLATDPTQSGSDNFLIIGDLNSYAMEDPITMLKSFGYVDLVNKFMGMNAYSYVFQGQAGYLDHALGSPDLLPRIADVQLWHINADEPVALDYNTYNQPELYTTEPYKSSDHDPVIVYLDTGFVYKLIFPFIAR